MHAEARRSSHIIQAVNTLEPAGAERVAVDLALSMHAAGWPTLVFALRGGPLKAALDAAGVPVHLGHPGENTLQSARRLAALQVQRPSLVHSHLIRAQLIARTSWFFRRPLALVETQHDTYPRPIWASAYRAATRRLVDLTVACSPKIAEHLRSDQRVPETRIRVIENGVDVNLFATGESPWHEHAVIGSIGSLLAVKRYDALLRAFASVAVKRPDIRLVLYGSGPERDALTALAAELGVSHAVSMPGTALDVPSALRAIDLFVQPRVRSSIGMALMEAMSAAKPVIVGVDQGFGGAPPKDVAVTIPSGDESQLARAIDEAVGDPGGSVARGARAREWVQQERSIDAVAAAYQSLYEDLISRSERF